MEIICREYRNSDYHEIVKLWLELYLSNPKRGDTQDIIEKTLQFGGKFFVLCLNNSIIGTSWITNDSRRLYLHHFGIKKEFQGKKFAWHLIKVSLSFAKESNMQIKLEVHKDNKIAIELYQKAGFERLGDYDVYIIRNPQTIGY